MISNPKTASCPFHRQACRIFSDSLWVPGGNTSQPFAIDYICVAVPRDIYNYGRCVSTGGGAACSLIDGVRGASCVYCKCEISEHLGPVGIWLAASNDRYTVRIFLGRLHPDLQLPASRTVNAEESMVGMGELACRKLALSCTSTLG